jgi:hypothetical protein
MDVIENIITFWGLLEIEPLLLDCRVRNLVAIRTEHHRPLSFCSVNYIDFLCKMVHEICVTLLCGWVHRR